MAALRKFLSTTKNRVSSTLAKTKRRPSQATPDEDFERRKHQWQEDLEQMSDFLVIKSTEEQRAEGVDCPVDTAFIDDRDGLPILKAVFDIRHFRPDDVTLTVENVEQNGCGVQRQLVLFAQCLDDSRECSVFKKTMLRRIDLPDFAETRWMSCRLDRPSAAASVSAAVESRLTIELPFHMPPQRRPAPGPGLVPIATDADGRRVIRFAVPIGPDFTSDDVSVEVDVEARQLSVSALYEAEIGHYGTQVTQKRLRRVFRLADGSTEWDSVVHSLDSDGRLNIEIRLKSMRPYKCDVTTEELELQAPASAFDAESVLEDGVDDAFYSRTNDGEY